MEEFVTLPTKVRLRGNEWTSHESGETTDSQPGEVCRARVFPDARSMRCVAESKLE
jgi:hypothetical protein